VWLSVEELVGTGATKGEHELGVNRVSAYQPAAAIDHFVLAAPRALTLDALPRRYAPSGSGGHFVSLAPQAARALQARRPPSIFDLHGLTFRSLPIAVQSSSPFVTNAALPFRPLK
jgi:hypothetical protein